MMPPGPWRMLHSQTITPKIDCTRKALTRAVAQARKNKR